MSTDWDKRAATYDQLGWVHNEDLLDWTTKHVLDAVRPAVGRTGCGRLLEVGCGTGALTERLAAERGLDVHAIDVSQEMIDRCHQRLTDAVRDNVVLDRARVEDLPISSGPQYAAIVSRMMLHHSPGQTRREPLIQLGRWAMHARAGASIVVVEGPPPTTDEPNDAVHLYRAAMALKEPGRHVFHAYEVAEWLLQLGCSEVRTAERWTENNSVRGWLAGGGIDPSRAEAILALHREASDAAKMVYHIRETPDGDVLMKWRHCVVVGVLT